MEFPANSCIFDLELKQKKALGCLISKKKKKTKKDETPSKEGRPSKYETKYCKMLIQHMGDGHTFESFGAVIDVARSTIYLWEKEHPEFSDAKKRGLDKHLLWMENLAKDGIWNEKHFDEKTGRCTYTRSLNSTLYIWLSKNIHGYKDNPEDKEQDKKLSIKLNYARNK